MKATSVFFVFVFLFGCLFLVLFLYSKQPTRFILSYILQEAFRHMSSQTVNNQSCLEQHYFCIEKIVVFS